MRPPRAAAAGRLDANLGLSFHPDYLSFCINDQTMTISKDSQKPEYTASGSPGHKPSWRRRASLYLLMVGVIALVVQYTRRQPISLDIVYHYNDLSMKLERARFAYERQGSIYASAEFNYRQQPAGRQQSHHVSLPPGNYDVHIELRYGNPRKVLRLKRTLPVREPGEASIHL